MIANKILSGKLSREEIINLKIKKNITNKQCIGYEEIPFLQKILKEYQVSGVNFILERERNSIYGLSGGILADATGLGKTLQMLSAMSYDKYILKTRDKNPKLGPTLIVCKNINKIDPWLKEILNSFDEGTFSYYIYMNESSKKLERNPDIFPYLRDQKKIKYLKYMDLFEYDVVIVSYKSLSNAYKKIIYSKAEKLWNREKDIDLTKIPRIPKGKNTRTISKVLRESIKICKSKRIGELKTIIPKLENNIHNLFKQLPGYDKRGTELLYGIYWGRVVCDEAHTARSLESLTAKAIRHLNSKCNWALTATPVHNTEKDFYSLLKNIIKFRPLSISDVGEWENLITRRDHVSSGTFGYIDTVYSQDWGKYYLWKEQIMLQRHKDILPLPDLQLDIVTLGFRTIEEKVIYSELCYKALKDIDQQDITLQKVKAGSMFAALQRMRMACVDPTAISKDFLKKLNKQFGPKNKIQDNIQSFKKKNYISTKFHMLYEYIVQRNIPVEDKILIFCDWLEPIENCKRFLRNQYPGFELLEINGSIDLLSRNRIMEMFKNIKKYKFLLLTTRSSCEGVNLTVANWVFFLGPWYNPYRDLQAFSRGFRIGQKKIFHVIYLIIKDSVESRIREIANQKIKELDKNYGGNRNKFMNKASKNTAREIIRDVTKDVENILNQPTNEIDNKLEIKSSIVKVSDFIGYEKNKFIYSDSEDSYSSEEHEEKSNLQNNNNYQREEMNEMIIIEPNSIENNNNNNDFMNKLKDIEYKESNGNKGWIQKNNNNIYDKVNKQVEKIDINDKTDLINLYDKCSQSINNNQKKEKWNPFVLTEKEKNTLNPFPLPNSKYKDIHSKFGKCLSCGLNKKILKEILVCTECFVNQNSTF